MPATNPLHPANIAAKLPMKNTVEDPETFAARLSAAIAASGLSLAEIARRRGYPMRTLQDWRYGKRTPPVYAQNTILKAIPKPRRKNNSQIIVE